MISAWRFAKLAVAEALAATLARQFVAERHQARRRLVSDQAPSTDRRGWLARRGDLRPRPPRLAAWFTRRTRRREAGCRLPLGASRDVGRHRVRPTRRPREADLAAPNPRRARPGSPSPASGRTRPMARDGRSMDAVVAPPLRVLSAFGDLGLGNDWRNGLRNRSIVAGCVDELTPVTQAHVLRGRHHDLHGAG